MLKILLLLAAPLAVIGTNLAYDQVFTQKTTYATPRQIESTVVNNPVDNTPKTLGSRSVIESKPQTTPAPQPAPAPKPTTTLNNYTYPTPVIGEVKIDCSSMDKTGDYSFNFGQLTYNECKKKTDEFFAQKRQEIAQKYANPPTTTYPTPTVVQKSKTEADTICRSEADGFLPNNYAAGSWYASCMGNYGYSVASPIYPNQ